MPHRRVLAPINTVKHYVQIENAATADAARRGNVLVDAVAGEATANTFEVQEGSIIKAVYVEYWAKSNATAGTEDKFQAVLEKVPTGTNGISFTQMNNMQAYPNKKNVFYYTQGVIGDLTTQSIPVLRAWFLIPKGKQRFGLGDRLVVSLSTTGSTLNNCGFATYKEWR